MNDSSKLAPEAGDDRARVAHRRAVIVSAAMVASLFVYAVVVEVIKRSGPATGSGGPDAIRWAFYAVAVSMVFMSHVVKGVMLRSRSPLSTGEALARLTAAHVVTAALSEAPAILGLALFLVSRRFYADFYILSVISLYLMIRHFPRYAQWERFRRQVVAQPH